MSETVLILGGSSGIGRALAHELAAGGASLVLAGRDVGDLERLAADCRVRFGTRAEVERFDALELDEHRAFFERCVKHFESGLDGVVLCHGENPPDPEARADIRVARRVIEVNYTSAVSLLELAATHLVERGRGWICAISSVAGDRGRPSNYLYGSTKAALSAYLQGLRPLLASQGVSVVTVKPGFVDTAMTWGKPGLFLVAAPATVAAAAMRGVRKDRAVVYTPRFWALIMLIIRLLPDWIFKRLSI